MGDAYDEALRRIAALEELVRDMHESMNTVSVTWTYDIYRERIAALGIGVSADELLGGVTR